MDKEKRENKTLTLAELLKKPIIKSKIGKNKLSEIAKQSTLFSFWENIAGNKLAKISKPYKIKDNKLYITAKSATVSQQLFFIKKKLLDKINSYSKPIGIEIEDMVLSYKNYDELTTTREIPVDEKMFFINNEQFKKIKLDDDLINSIKNSVNKIEMLNEKQKKELTEKILDNYKADLYRKNIENV